MDKDTKHGTRRPESVIKNNYYNKNTIVSAKQKLFSLKFVDGRCTLIVKIFNGSESGEFMTPASEWSQCICCSKIAFIVRTRSY